MSRPTVPGLVRALEAHGVQVVFGLPGTQNVDLFEALRGSSLRVVQATSELAAAFMAVGYGRAGGRPGVLVTIPGPGFVYALPGLAEARLDSVPLIHLVVQHPSQPGKRFRHQEIDHLSLARALAKAVIRVDLEPGDDGTDGARAVEEAWEAAVSGEPGPVVLWVGELDGAEDAAPLDGRARSEDGAGRMGAANPVETARPGILALDPGTAAIGKRLTEARRPILFLGMGAQGHPEQVLALAERMGAPVVTTPSARGLVPEDHRLSTAFDYDRGGLGVLNELLESGDLILVLGCKLGHNGSGGFGLRLPEDRTVQVNTDPAALGSNYPASLLVQADVAKVLAGVLAFLEESVETHGWSWTGDEVAGWRSRIAAAVPGGPAEPEPSAPGAGGVREVLQALREELPRDAIVVTDSGLHQVMVRRHFPVLAPGGLMTPTDFQSMGFGLPAAVGAALACPERKVVAIIGDGGLAMSGMELVTLAREGLPVMVLVFRDGHLNLIRLHQEREYGKAYATEVVGPEPAALAEAAVVGFLPLDKDPGHGVRAALASGGPVLVDLPLGDSSSIRSVRRKAALKAGVREVVGEGWVERLKKLLGR